ncbi:AAA family ATPase [Streptomyces pactum]|uniref:AAA family ATPase n=1 Tax=Streptomyces pactum TaxID=68249 RepID=UPI0036F4BB91
MEQPDATGGTTTGPGRDTRNDPAPAGRDRDARTAAPDTHGPRADGAGAGYHVGIGGSAAGAVIAGHHNVVVDAQHGSTVNLLVERERPRPVRRARVELLPRRQHTPLGREAELAALADAVRAGGPVQVWGPPGVGKSTLLRHAARTLEPGPDGVLFLVAHHREPGDLAQEVFEACYEAAGYAPSANELRRLMAGIRVTVYLDNAELTEEALRELMDAAPGATFVLAGRERTLLGDGTALELDGLDRAAGLRLLTRGLAHPAPGSEHVAAELWKAAAGRPLLLLRAAALARPDASGRAVLPRPGTMADLLPLLLDQLDAQAMGALRLLATLHDAELDPVHVGALAGAPDPAALCGRLVDLGLAQATEHGFRCAADAAQALRERDPAPYPVDRLCEHLAHWAAQPSTSPGQVAAHARALELAAQLAERAGRPDLAVRVTRAASPALARSLRFGAWGRVLGQGRVAARQAGDRRAAAYFTHEEGIRSLLTGRRALSGILLAEAAVLWRQLGDGHGADAAASAQQYVPPPAPGQGEGWSSPGTPGDGGPVPPGDPTAAQNGGVPGGDGAAGPAGNGTGGDPTAGASTTTPGGDPTAGHGTVPSGADPVTGQGPVTPGSHPTPGQGAGPPGGDTTAGQSGSAPGGGPAAGPGTGTPGGDPAAGQSTVAPGGDSATGQGGWAPDGGPGADPGNLAHHGADPFGGVPQGPPGPDPLTGLSGPPGPVPPGAGEAAGLAGGTAGGAAPAGAVAAGGATAAGASTLAVTVVLKVLAVVAALVIAGVAVHERQTSDDPSAATGLAGVWQDAQGGQYRFTESASGGYTVTGATICGETVTLEFTDDGGSYRSSDEPLYDTSGGSCTRIGHLDTTITLGSDGNSAEWERELPPGSSASDCSTNCGTVTLTRVS